MLDRSGTAAAGQTHVRFDSLASASSDGVGRGIDPCKRVLCRDAHTRSEARAEADGLLEVSWLLPASKVDPGAVDISRAHGCSWGMLGLHFRQARDIITEASQRYVQAVAITESCCS